MPISSSRRWVIGAGTLVCAASIGIGGASAEPVVAAGHSVSLLTASSIDPTCHSQGPVTVNVIEPPRGGFLEVLQVKAFPNFNTLNARARCDTLKLPATQVIYQSAGTFLGTDSVTLELIFPGGNARRVRLPITVRPVTADFAPSPPQGAETLAPEPTPPATPDRPKKPVHRHKSVVAAARHHPDMPGAKATDHPPAPPAAARDPMVKT